MYTIFIIFIFVLFRSLCPEYVFQKPTPYRYDPRPNAFRNWEEVTRATSIRALLRNNIVSVTYCIVATGFVSVRRHTGVFFRFSVLIRSTVPIMSDISFLCNLWLRVYVIIITLTPRGDPLILPPNIHLRALRSADLWSTPNPTTTVRDLKFCAGYTLCNLHGKPAKLFCTILIIIIRRSENDSIKYNKNYKNIE